MLEFYFKFGNVDYIKILFAGPYFYLPEFAVYCSKSMLV